MKTSEIQGHSSSTRCALCGRPAILRMSHTIPDFVLRFAKSDDNALLPSFLTAESPGRPVQQAFRKPLLGDCCEQLFGDWETKFASLIFTPCVLESKVDRNQFSEDWFKKIGISFAWRAAENILAMHPALSIVDQNLIRDAMSSWRESLLYNKSPFSTSKWTFLKLEDVDPVDESAVAEVMSYPDWYLTYLTSMCDYGLISDVGKFGIYYKLPCMTMWISILPDRHSEPPDWKYLSKAAMARCELIKAHIDAHTPDHKRIQRSETISKRHDASHLAEFASKQAGQARNADNARLLERQKTVK